jgi:hypothetical protein
MASVGNLVANRHKWRFGHESVAPLPTFLQLVRQKKMSNFALNLLIISIEPICFIASNGSRN